MRVLYSVGIWMRVGKDMGRVSCSTRMGGSMKDTGRETTDMGMGLNFTIMEIHTEVGLRRERPMDRVVSHGPMGRPIKGTLRVGRNMGMVPGLGFKDRYTLVIGSGIRSKGKGLILILMGLNMMVIGLRIKNMGRELKFTLMETSTLEVI